MSIDEKEFERLKLENQVFNKQVPELYETIAALKKASLEWYKLEKIATPDKWLKMYADYQELLLKEDVTEFWAQQYSIADKERQHLKIDVSIYKSFMDKVEEYFEESGESGTYGHPCKPILEIINELKKTE